MRSGHQWQLAAVTVGVSEHPFASVTRCAHLATLRHFEDKLTGTVKTGSLIPCERRLAKTEIPENQELTFESRFANRDYDRPFLTFLVTLARFD